jgi:hypothetical protein
LIVVAEVAAFIAAFALLLIAGAAVIAASSMAAERRVAQSLMEWQLITAMRAETEYQKALADFEGATAEVEKRAWKKEPSN